MTASKYKFEKKRKNLQNLDKQDILQYFFDYHVSTRNKINHEYPEMKWDGNSTFN